MTRAGSVLVVDDEEIMREILEALLAPEGYEVRVASNGMARARSRPSAPLDATRTS